MRDYPYLSGDSLQHRFTLKTALDKTTKIVPPPLQAFYTFSLSKTVYLNHRPASHLKMKKGQYRYWPL